MAIKNKEHWQKEAKKQMLSMQVRAIRKTKRLTVKEVASASGYEPQTIRKIENGNFLPEDGRDIPLANALGVSLDQLWGRKRIEHFFDNGQPKLYEHEKIALTIFAPILKSLSKEGRDFLLLAAETIVLAEDANVAWNEYIKNE